MKNTNVHKDYLQNERTQGNKQTDLDYIHQFMEEHEIHILPQLKPAYNNHLKMMLERFKNNQCTSLVGKEGTESVSEENLKLAQQLLTPLFQKYAIHPNETEEVLIALYIQVSKKEGEKK